MNQACGFKDQIQIFEVNEDGSFGKLVLETNNEPSPEQIQAMEEGTYNCAADRLTDNGLQDITEYIHDTYAYIGIGTDGSVVSDTANTLVAQYGDRYAATTGTDQTYCSDGYVDTAVFTCIFTAPGNADLCESAVFKESTSTVTDIMLCRQTFCTWSIVSGNSYGIIWKVISARG